jgi:hypothetical protein
VGLKDTSCIPFGCYCYTILEKIIDEKIGIRLITKNCPYYSQEREYDLFGWCSFVGVEVTDMTKSCNENWEDV